MCEPISMTAEMMAALAAASEAAPAAAATAETASTAMTAAEAAQAAAESEAALGGIDALQAAGSGGMGVAQNGIGAGTLANQFAGLLNNPASALSSNGMPANLAKGLLTGGGSKASAPVMAQIGMGLLNPQRPPPPQGGGMPMGGGQAAPLHMPYGTPTGNSLGQTMPLTEEQKKRLRMQGYRI